MALPSMPHYWTTRRNVYEQAIVRNRNHDDHLRERWGHTADYFQRSNIAATKQTEWESEKSLKSRYESEKSLKSSMDAYQKGKDSEKKAKNLALRREKLAAMLRQERYKFEAELKGYSLDNFDRLEDMKDRVDSLRSAREEKRKNLAEEKLYEHWRQNNPDIRKIEAEQLKDHVVDKWGSQMEEFREKEEQERIEKEKFEREMEEERVAALELERQKEEDRLEEEKKWKDVLREQMFELRDREAEAERLKKEQDALQTEQWRLEDLEDERKKMESARGQREMGRMLLRQHKAQMMRRSRQIQEELEQDKRMLEALIERENEEREMLTTRREKAQADAAWMKQVIEDQLRVEKAREAELDMLYQEEAARMWEKRDAEWARESKARERLMSEVFKDRQQQIEEKLEEVQQEREESLRQREKLIAEMEIANQMTQRDLEKAEEQKEALKLDLEGQITSRQEQKLTSRQRMVEEEENEKRQEQDYEDFLQKETERMRVRGFAPKNFGRRTAWM
ncbi:trichoplein keratin filament-binding protein-like isoform X2 [Ostrea edulis]|uniref:trichoplein keratin filament-binding protein-like isoform X2 n=1 Tax=Ostrea edulis TaxID=37623 RepID=UPI002094F6DB|nr:trichoplein keratin filament-binding protein-like isoform X2 [Ostrea edulis]